MDKLLQQKAMHEIYGQIINLRSIYFYMIDHYPPGCTFTFWEKYSLRLKNKIVTNQQLFHTIWLGNENAVLQDIFLIYKDFEALLLKRNIAFESFIKSIYKRLSIFSISNNQGTHNAIEPILLLNEDIDLRDCILKHADINHKNLNTNGFFKPIEHRIDGETNITTMMLHYFLTSETKLAYNVYKWVGLFYKYVPGMLGLLNFENVYSLTDCRSIDFILNDETYDISISDSSLFINAQKIGTCKPLSTFIRKYNFPIEKNLYTDCTIVEVEKNIYHKNGTEILLHKGCAYNAPFYLLQFQYQCIKDKKKNQILKDIVHKISTSDIYTKKRKNVHNSVLELFEKRCRITYNRKKQMISINDTVVFRSTVARIFNKLVKKNYEENQEEFLYSEFSRDRKVIYHCAKPNLHIHFNRIELRIKNLFPFININRIERGKVLFSCAYTLVYREL